MENTYEYDEFLTTYLTSLKRDFILNLYLNIFSKENNRNYRTNQAKIEEIRIFHYFSLSH